MFVGKHRKIKVILNRRFSQQTHDEQLRQVEKKMLIRINSSFVRGVRDLFIMIIRISCFLDSPKCVIELINGEKFIHD